MRTAVKHNKGKRDGQIECSEVRFTPYRRLIYDVLSEKPDHPTADELFFRARKKLPDISLATVYNCLEALVKLGLVKQVNADRSATRYCPNLSDHAHFVCAKCKRVYDINLSIGEEAELFKKRLPKGFKINTCEIIMRGICQECSKQQFI